MAINYALLEWDTTKYINPSNMNYMDQGIKAACDGVDELDTKMGATDISSIGDGSVTGALSTLNGGKVSKNGDTMTGDLIINNSASHSDLKIGAANNNNYFGRLLLYRENGYSMQLNALSLTRSRNIQLPDADGTLALTNDLNSYVPRVGDSNIKGAFAITSDKSGYAEGLRINRASNGYSTLLLGGASDSTSGTGDCVWWIGCNPVGHGRKLWITHNGSTAGNTFFGSDSETQYSPYLNLGASGSIESGNTKAVDGNTVFNYIQNSGFIVTGNVDVSSSGASTEQEAAQKWCQLICATYPNKEYTIFEGAMNYRGVFKMSVLIYNTSRVDANNNPQYAWGTMQVYSNLYKFNFSNYVFSITE